MRWAISGLASTERQKAYFSPFAHSTAQRTFSQTLMLGEDVGDLEGAGQPAAVDLVGRQASDRRAVQADLAGARHAAGR